MVLSKQIQRNENIFLTNKNFSVFVELLEFMGHPIVYVCDAFNQRFSRLQVSRGQGEV